jgi:hypothetical protein
MLLPSKLARIMSLLRLGSGRLAHEIDRPNQTHENSQFFVFLTMIIIIAAVFGNEFVTSSKTT